MFYYSKSFGVPLFQYLTTKLYLRHLQGGNKGKVVPVLKHQVVKTYGRVEVEPHALFPPPH